MDAYRLMPHASMGVYVCCDANTTNGSMLDHYLTSGELKQKLKALHCGIRIESSIYPQGGSLQGTYNKVHPIKHYFHNIQLPGTSLTGVPFPKNFLQICKKILCRLFRVFVHVYIHHFDRIILMGAEAHVNTCYKHFYYFVTELNLIDRKELEPLVFQAAGTSGQGGYKADVWDFYALCFANSIFDSLKHRNTILYCGTNCSCNLFRFDQRLPIGNHSYFHKCFPPLSVLLILDMLRGTSSELHGLLRKRRTNFRLVLALGDKNLFSHE
ncbi:hypothetical protein Q9233_016159 [Columba guinea]|nr:hypothetical protein Q9233_016159 [Columba guinea]